MRSSLFSAGLVLLFSTSLAAKQPNILIMLADDLNLDSIGCYGNPDVRTPNLDQLAREGMRFTNATTTTAMCAPTRQMMYTGLYPVRSGAYPNHSQVKPGTQSIVHYLRALGYRVGLNGKRHFGPAKSFPFDRVGGGNFDQKAIQEYVNRKSDKPFCLIVASHSPHVPWRAGDSSAYNASMLTVPRYWVDTPPMRKALTRYYAEVTDFDRQLGICLTILKKSRKDQQTLVLVSSEQGSQFPGCKWTCYEKGLRVGMIARWPGRINPGSVSNAWVNHVDVTPTCVAVAGGQPVDGLDGRSFHKVLSGHASEHNTVAYGVHTQKGAIGSPPTGYAVRSVRIGHYKYIANLNHKVKYNNALTQNDNERYWASWLEKAKTDAHAALLVKRYLHRPPVELYDLDADPDELNNLIADPKYGEIAKRLRKHLDGWMASQGDKGQATELAVKPRKARKKGGKRKLRKKKRNQ